MDTLRGIPEHVEADFGDSIVTRDEAVALLGTCPGLGPPDLCWLQKSQKKTLLGRKAEAQGYYHYVLGRDVSSSAAVAAYFALLNSKTEPLTLLQGLWLTSEYTIQRGFYCCYDPLSRTDLRCELCVPGGVVVGCVDAAGTLHDVTPQLWMQAQVCSFVRAVLYDPEMRLNGGSVITCDPVPTAEAEHSLLTAVYTLYSSGSLPGALQDIYAEQGCGVLPEHMDVVLAALWQHFRRRQRWQAAEHFFRQLTRVYSPAALLVTAAARAQGISSMGHDSPGMLLSDLLLHHSSELLPPASLVGLGAELLQSGQPAEAAHLARQALQLNHRCRPAWLLLSQCFIAQHQYAAALVTLNVVPTPPLPAAEVELLHVVPPPPPKSTTHPLAVLYDGELESVKACALEEASLDGSRLLAYLPGAILVNREPLGAAYLPDTGPNRITRSVLAAVYNLLQDIVAATSWDAFLEVRSRVFLMQQEATPRASQELPGHHQQRQHSIEQQAKQHSSSLELPGQQQQQKQQQMAAAVEEKLQQLGLHQTEPTVHPQQQQHQQPAQPAAMANGQQPHPAIDTTAPALSNGVGGFGSFITRSPTSGSAGGSGSPPTRGQLSSSGGHKGSPKSYYATRLHEELLKPTSAGLIRPAAGTHMPAQQQQAHQQHELEQRPSAPPAVGALDEVTAAGQSSDPGEQQRSMTGRVLLLGRTQARRVSKPGESGPASSNSSSSAFGGSTGVGCGVPRSLAPNEIEDLSRYASASRVAPLRPQPGASITPELFDVVFGAHRRSPPPGTGRTAVQQQQQHHDAISKAAAALPRIRTRPIAEGMEGKAGAFQHCSSCHTTYSAGHSVTAGHSTHSTSGVMGVGSCSRLEDACISPSSGTLPYTPPSNSSRSKPHMSGCLFSCLRPQHQQWQQSQDTGYAPQQHHQAASSSHVAPGPVAEGLDRTGSLLLRTTSAASSSAGPGGGGSARLAGSGPSGQHAFSSQHSTGGFGAADSGGSRAFGASLARKASITGEAISRTLEDDRRGLIEGWLCDDESVEVAGAEGPPGRRLCVRWLDELIVSLWHDLQAYMEWKVCDQTLKEQRGGTHAELVLGLLPQSATPRTPVSDGGNLNPPTLTAIDWMRRGALAERLGHVSDARAAYRAAVKLHFNLTSYLALLRLEAQAGNVNDTQLCAAQIMAWHQQRITQLGGSSSSSSSDVVVKGVPPEVVGWALGLVADSSSVDDVKQAAAGAPAAVAAALDEWAKWQHGKPPIIN